MSSKGASHLNLKQCLAIQANQYRSSDNRRDYQPEEIEDRIHTISANQSAKAIKQSIQRFETSKQEIAQIVVKPAPEATVELVTEFREYWKVISPNGFSYQIIEIPNQIMNF
jgi:hypothetical protein